MIAGPNGSGKSTLTEELRRAGVQFGTYINPDEIAKTLEGDYGTRVRAAQAIADAERDRCLRSKESFTFETVMSHDSKVELMRRAQVLGFTTALYFISTESSDLNVDRVRQRVDLGGHDVPEEKIRERYDRTMSLLPAALLHADHFVLFDNTRTQSEAFPIVLRPFFRRTPGGTVVSPPIPLWAIPALKGWMPLD